MEIAWGTLSLARIIHEKWSLSVIVRMSDM